jgi:hypothetical protein
VRKEKRDERIGITVFRFCAGFYTEGGILCGSFVLVGKVAFEEITQFLAL